MNTKPPRVADHRIGQIKRDFAQWAEKINLRAKTIEKVNVGGPLNDVTTKTVAQQLRKAALIIEVAGETYNENYRNEEQ